MKVQKASNLQEPSRFTNGSAKDFLIINGSSAPNGSVELNVFPRHALHDKGIQIQIGVVPLVGSQERRALFVPLMNRLSSAGQPLVLFLRRLT